MNNRNPFVYARPFSNDTDAEPMYQRPDQAQQGLDLRTHVAVKAMQAMITGYWSNPAEDNIKADRMAVRAFEYADAFMAEYNRPADEAEARRNAEIKAGRELVAKGRYLMGSDQRRHPGEDATIYVEFVWDRTLRELTAARLAIEPDDALESAEREWRRVSASDEPQMLDDVPEQAQRMEETISLKQPHNLEDWGYEVSNELPAWAQPEEGRNEV